MSCDLCLSVLAPWQFENLIDVHWFSLLLDYLPWIWFAVICRFLSVQCCGCKLFIIIMSLFLKNILYMLSQHCLPAVVDDKFRFSSQFLWRILNTLPVMTCRINIWGILRMQIGGEASPAWFPFYGQTQPTIWDYLEFLKGESSTLKCLIYFP